MLAIIILTSVIDLCFTFMLCNTTAGGGRLKMLDLENVKTWKMADQMHANDLVFRFLA